MLLLQRLRVALPRLAAGAAIATPLAYGLCRHHEAAHCEAKASDDKAALLKQMIDNYGNYGEHFMELASAAERKHLEPGE